MGRCECAMSSSDSGSSILDARDCGRSFTRDYVFLTISEIIEVLDNGVS
jgi:hypothetical protein